MSSYELLQLVMSSYEMSQIVMRCYKLLRVKVIMSITHYLAMSLRTMGCIPKLNTNNTYFACSKPSKQRVQIIE